MGFGSQIWESYLGVEFGSQIWDSNLRVESGSRIWGSNLGVEIWESNLGAEFESQIWGNVLGSPISHYLRGFYNKGYCITLDNFYTSPEIAKESLSLETDCCGIFA